jgi:hypothetical protein
MEPDGSLTAGAMEKSHMGQTHAELADALCAHCRSLNYDSSMPNLKERGPP